MNPARRTTTTAIAATAVVLTTAGALLSTAAPVASAATTCNSPAYKRQFFANTALSGTPKRTDCDAAIAENWGAKTPATGLPKDNFSVRWTVTRDFGSGGPFALTVAAQDGIRVYLDGKAKVNLWKNVTSTQKKTVNLTLPSGKHTLRIDYANFTGNANVNFTYAPRTSASIDKVKPLAPTGLVATYSAETQQTKLSWSKNVEMDFASYAVHRHEAPNGLWELVNRATTATSHTDTPPANGKNYEYLVRAYDKAGNTSAETARATVTSTTVGTPTGFTATGTDTGVALAWDTVPGASRYSVLRTAKGEPNRSWQPTGTSWADNGMARSAKYEYRVSAVDASGRPAGYTPLAAASRLVAAPSNVQAFPQLTGQGNVRATLIWRVDEETGGDYRGFRVYRYLDASARWAEVTARCRPYQRALADGTIQHLCTDYSAEAGGFHRYVVTGYDRTDAESIPSAEASTTNRDAQAPAAPASTTAVSTEWGTVVTWKPVTDVDLDHYSVFRGTTVTDGDSVSCSDFVHIDDADVAATSYTDVNLADGEQLCYVVRAVDFAGRPGDSAAAHTTEPDLRPTVETPPGATHTAWASVSGLSGWRTDVDVSLTSPAGTEEYKASRSPVGTR